MKFVKCLCNQILIGNELNTTTATATATFVRCKDCFYLETNPYYRGFDSSTEQEEVSVSQVRYMLTNIVKDYHTCSLLMKQKRILESLIRKSNNPELLAHQKVRVNRKKYWYYLKISQDILPRQQRKGTYIPFTLRQNILKTTSRILTIYDKKIIEKGHLKSLLQAYENEEDQRYAFADQYENEQAAIMADW